jgi:hypothetical protein
MLKALEAEAPFSVFGMVSCSMSGNVVEAGRCSQCSYPTRSDTTRKKTIRRGKQSRRALPQNLIAGTHPSRWHRWDEGSEGLLSQGSVRATVC